MSLLNFSFTWKTKYVGIHKIGDMTNETNIASPQCDNKWVANFPCGCLNRRKNIEYNWVVQNLSLGNRLQSSEKANKNLSDECSQFPSTLQTFWVNPWNRLSVVACLSNRLKSFSCSKQIGIDYKKLLNFYFISFSLFPYV